MKQSLKPLSLIFVLAFLSSSLHAQQTTTVVRVFDGDTLKIRYWEQEINNPDLREDEVNKLAGHGRDLKCKITVIQDVIEYIKS